MHSRVLSALVFSCTLLFSQSQAAKQSSAQYVPTTVIAPDIVNGAQRTGPFNLPFVPHPKFSFHPSPTLSAEFLAAEKPGMVRAAIQVGSDGKVVAVKITETDAHGSLDDAARDLFKRTVYAPEKRKGKAIEFETDVVMIVTFGDVIFSGTYFDIAAVDVKPVAIFMARPVYPAAERRRGEQGEAIVSLVVEIDGSVSETELVRTTAPAFGAAAQAAVRKWRYRPGQKNGQPVRVSLQVPIAFSISP